LREIFPELDTRLPSSAIEPQPEHLENNRFFLDIVAYIVDHHNAKYSKKDIGGHRQHQNTSSFIDITPIT